MQIFTSIPIANPGNQVPSRRITLRKYSTPFLATFQDSNSLNLLRFHHSVLEVDDDIPKLEFDLSFTTYHRFNSQRKFELEYLLHHLSDLSIVQIPNSGSLIRILNPYVVDNQLVRLELIAAKRYQTHMYMAYDTEDVFNLVSSLELSPQ